MDLCFTKKFKNRNEKKTVEGIHLIMVVILGWGRVHPSKKIGQIEFVFKPTNFF